eukprot:2866047-Rhodomonas_salina.1
MGCWPGGAETGCEAAVEREDKCRAFVDGMLSFPWHACSSAWSEQVREDVPNFGLLLCADDQCGFRAAPVVGDNLFQCRHVYAAPGDPPILECPVDLVLEPNSTQTLVPARPMIQFRLGSVDAEWGSGTLYFDLYGLPVSEPGDAGCDAQGAEDPGPSAQPTPLPNLRNGDFEMDLHITSDAPSNLQSQSTEWPAFWDATGAVFLVQPGHSFPVTVLPGASVEMDWTGSGNVVAVLYRWTASISQNVTGLVPGVRYLLTFRARLVTHNTWVGVSTEDLALSASVHSLGYQWKDVELAFTALATHAILRFEALPVIIREEQSEFGTGIYLDNIALAPEAPSLPPSSGTSCSPPPSPTPALVLKTIGQSTVLAGAPNNLS